MFIIIFFIIFLIISLICYFYDNNKPFKDDDNDKWSTEGDDNIFF